MKPTHPSPADSITDFTLRHDLQPGDLGNIVHLHGTFYAHECGFDPTYEAYVANGVAAFAQAHDDRGRLWIAECGRQFVGCLAIVGLSPKDAQLRWFLVDPSAQGLGVDERLLGEAVAFCEHCAYEYVFLWSIRGRNAMDKLYRSFGFEKVQEKSSPRWGVEVVEERYALNPAARRFPSKREGSTPK
ncbi:MAG TPA: GNAT family N-acetyltransferase [Gemmataceae bacterium]|nr:GNAT family N-acetyltransferase [Gemmataceae bacterium]